MDNPPPSPRESSNQQLLSSEEASRQPLKFTQQQAYHQSSSYMARSTSGTNEYTTAAGNASGHNYTISTCATNASGPSTSQTWASGPATIQISNSVLPDISSQADTSIQASTRIMPIDTPQTTSAAVTQQVMESVYSQPVRVTTSQHQNTSYGSSGLEQQTTTIRQRSTGEMKAGQNLQPQQTDNLQTSQQQWTISKTLPPETSTTSGQPQTTTQWTPDSYIELSQTRSQISQPQQTTGLTAYISQSTDGGAQSNFRSTNDQAKDFYNKAYASYGNVTQQTQSINQQRQMSSTSHLDTNAAPTQVINSSIMEQHQRTNSGSVVEGEAQIVSETSHTVMGEPRETVRTISSHLDYSKQKVSENVVRREYGEARVISHNEHRLDNKAYVKSERVISHEVVVPKRVAREQITERVVVEKEKKLVEEIVQDTCMVKEKIIEWARPRIVDKVVEQPEIVHEEVTITVTETIARPRIVYQDVPTPQVREVIKNVVVPREVEQIITEVVKREVPVEKVVYVDELQDIVVPKEVKGPSKVVEVPQPVTVTRDSIVDVQRTIPVSVEAEMVCEVKVPEIKPRYKKIAYPVYLPKFIEVPMAVDLMTESLQNESTEFTSKINGFTKTAASLCDIENLASNIMRMDHGATAANLMSADNLQAAVAKAWEKASIGENRVGQYNMSAASGMMSSNAEGVMNASSSAQYVTSSYTTTQTMKNELPQSLVAVS